MASKKRISKAAAAKLYEYVFAIREAELEIARIVHLQEVQGCSLIETTIEHFFLRLIGPENLN